VRRVSYVSGKRVPGVGGLSRKWLMAAVITGAVAVLAPGVHYATASPSAPAVHPQAATLAALDRILAPYGGLGAIGRKHQTSNRILTGELSQLGALAGMVPLVFLGVGILLNTIRLFAPSLHNVPSNPLEQLATTPGQAALFSLVAILAGGLREELQRAFMLRRFEQYLGGAVVGVWVISIAFGLGHLMQGWDAVVTTGTLGAFWAWIYLRRRSSIAPIVSHAGFNSLEILRLAVLGA